MDYQLASGHDGHVRAYASAWRSAALQTAPARSGFQSQPEIPAAPRAEPSAARAVDPSAPNPRGPCRTFRPAFPGPETAADQCPAAPCARVVLRISASPGELTG